MSGVRLFWNSYRYFPYERALARREAAVAFGQRPVEVDDGLEFADMEAIPPAASRLTYFSVVQNGTTLVVPDQTKLEASASGNGSAWDPDADPVPVLRRQSTRYSAHGLHEYRGKFNPQVVRAVGNLLGLVPCDWVLDPFCGSGTTLLEAAHIGWNAVGIDLNPLGVFIANAKLAAFGALPVVLNREAEKLLQRLNEDPGGDDWRDHLPEPEYLESWFPVAVLRKLWAILKVIDAVQPADLQNVFRVVLSDICREVSFQDPADLRIRRRKNPADDYPVIELFTEAVRARVCAVVRVRQVVSPTRGTTQSASRGDIRAAAGVLTGLLAGHRKKGFDAAITSPPYATAMPYLDTQRLSLALFGMIRSGELRQREKEQIGNREIQDGERRNLEAELAANAAALPDPVIDFCRRLLTLADDPSHGFRRRNVPALVYKYLADMAAMFGSVREVIRKDGRFALVVGRNATELRGETVVIDTPQLLADTASSRGWLIEEMTPFETYHRFDLHQENSIREEVLLVIRRV
jgi:site-specific DNA-methyltransferase (cytosine-N4-specific)